MHVKIRPKHSPNKAQEFMVLVIFASFPAAFASETDGRRDVYKRQIIRSTLINVRGMICTESQRS